MKFVEFGRLSQRESQVNAKERGAKSSSSHDNNRARHGQAAGWISMVSSGREQGVARPLNLVIHLISVSSCATTATTTTLESYFLLGFFQCHPGGGLDRPFASHAHSVLGIKHGRLANSHHCRLAAKVHLEMKGMSGKLSVYAVAGYCVVKVESESRPIMTVVKFGPAAAQLPYTVGRNSQRNVAQKKQLTPAVPISWLWLRVSSSSSLFLFFLL